MLISLKKAQPRIFLIAKSSKGWLWHRRLGHVGMRNLDKLIKGDHILGIKKMSYLTRIDFAVLVKQEGKLEEVIP